MTIAQKKICRRRFLKREAKTALFCPNLTDTHEKSRKQPKSARPESAGNEKLTKKDIFARNTGQGFIMTLK
jgi:hypothetical protein